MTNDERADRASRIIIEPYRKETGDEHTKYQTLLADALADLMHLADICGGIKDFNNALTLAEIHFNEETEA